MKKQILSIIVLGMSLLTFSASAQHRHDGARGNKAKAQTECVAPENCSPDAECAPDNCCGGFFDGITLTPDQETKLKALKESNNNQRKEKAKEARDARRANKAQADSARKADQKNYLHSVKKILTPEQYVQFLENMVTSRPARPEGPRAGKAPRPENFRDGARAERATKQKMVKKAEDQVVISGSAKKAQK